MRDNIVAAVSGNQVPAPPPLLLLLLWSPSSLHAGHFFYSDAGPDVA